ncbi:MAG: COX15/CtaA family protein [Gammaproteobacteria bacterium]|nr:COX15/CtaA family protein [Gammaproteobacteria bacterium]MCZ6911609.1 COX15/CtaA family protein [Pseudomonadota bacterium]
MAKRPPRKKYYRHRGPSAELIRFKKLALVATFLALVVVVLGAYTRLSDAGLGCPDWPGCYGRISVPATAFDISTAQQAYPDRPLEQDKAWIEMVHRYFAGALGLLVATLTLLALLNRNEKKQPVLLPVLLLPIIIFQALLGMWTVTLLLKPVVVIAHLLGGMVTLALLWWLAMTPAREQTEAGNSLLAKASLLALLVVIAQISLGGWTSSNYAALACPDFPTCQGAWWPEADFEKAFESQPPLDPDSNSGYAGGVLAHPARIAIHMSHRVGALVVVSVNLMLGFLLLSRSENNAVAQSGIALMIITATQVLVGISIVKLGLPLSLATVHNGMAALLLLSLVTTNRLLRMKL